MFGPRLLQNLNQIDEGTIQEAYTGEIIQERRSFKPTFEAVTSPPAQLYGAYDRYYSSNLYFQ